MLQRTSAVSEWKDAVVGRCVVFCDKPDDNQIYTNAVLTKKRIIPENQTYNSQNTNRCFSCVYFMFNQQNTEF